MYQRWFQTGETSNRRLCAEATKGHLWKREAEDSSACSRVIHATMTEITNEFNSCDAQNVPHQTVHRALLPMGLRSRRPIHAHIFTVNHRRKCIL